MSPRTRQRLRTSAWALGGLVLLYLLLGWFAFEPLVQWAAPKWVAEQSGRRLTLAQARFNPFRLSAEVRDLALAEADGRPLLSVESAVVDFDATSLFRGAWAFDRVVVTEPVVQVELRADGHLNWLDLLDAFAGPPKPQGTAAPALPRALVHRLALVGGRVELVDQQITGGYRTRIEPLQIELNNLSTLHDDRGDYSLSARTAFGAVVQWKGQVGLNPIIASGELAVSEVSLARLWPYLKESLNMAPPEGLGALKLSYQASYANRQFNLNLSGLTASLNKLVLRDTPDSAPRIALDSVQVNGGRLDLARRDAGVDSVKIDGGRAVVEIDVADRVRMLDWLRTRVPTSAGAASAASPAQAASAANAKPWRVAVDSVEVDRLALQLIDDVFVAPLDAQVGQVQLRFKAQAELGTGEPKLKVDALGMLLQDIQVASGKRNWLRVAELALQDGRASLADRDVSLGRVALNGGRIEAGRDAEGRLTLLDALARRSAPAAALAAARKDQGWHYRVDKLGAQKFELALRDESFSPALQLDIVDLAASAEGLSDNPKAQVPVQLKLRFKQGGRFEARGRIAPSAPSADLTLELADLALTPAQPLLAQTTNLVVADGKAFAKGRVRYQPSAASYRGSFAINQLQLNEAGSGDPIAGWKSLASQDVNATTEQVHVGLLTLDGLVGKLVVFKDRTVNVARLLKPAPKTAPAAAPASAPQPPAMRIDVDRVRLTQSDVDFSDLSLVLPFRARVHDLHGDMVGLSTQPGTAAQLEFDGQVDEFGLARALGQINLFDPTGFTDIKVAFRNVEMTALTAYSATFAGRKIESGKLSLDLEYKIKQRQLAGDNRVVMEKLTLGERVESPTAVNLPLDLALAILRDSDGKIDLGLPVSGSLDDPQFSYGGIIWKAFVNVITKIVTAPFRALMGGAGEKLDKIDFDAGSATLLPPEKEKLANVAKLMDKRPALALTVRAGFAPKADGQALREQQLRAAIAQQGGREPAAGVDPGPINTAQPQARAALESLYAKRFGADALTSLQRRVKQANPQTGDEGMGGRMLSRLSSVFQGPAPVLSAEESAQLRGADVHALMLQRLLDEPVADEAARLRSLGTERSETIRRELLGRGLADARLRVEAPQAHEPEDGAVTAQLKVETQSAAAPASAAAR